MPRNEGFLDPGAGPLASFAWDLRALRETAGNVPYRVLAKRAGFCASTLSVAASGAKLPSLDVTLAYVQACGGDPETWRERWHALAAQHPAAISSPNAQPELHVAPPYDADEQDEPARLGAATLLVPPGGGASTDRELVAVRDLVSAAESGHHAIRPDPAIGAASPRAPIFPAGLSRGLRWRSRRPAVSISRVATVALTLITAVLGVKVAQGTGAVQANSANPVPAATSPGGTAMEQADALYMVIYEFTPMRSDANGAIWDLSGCRNLSNAQSQLRAIARKRQEQVEQLAVLNVSKVPDHVQLVAALKHAWLTSAQSDTAYANIAADLQTGCTSGAIETDPNYQQADDYAQAASAAKAEAAGLWNANADALGQLRISGAEL
jgi:helix-turn-helix protein